MASGLSNIQSPIFTIYKHYLDRRYLVVSVDVVFENDDSCFDVWLMNNGTSPIVVREIWYGSGRLLDFFTLTRIGLSPKSFLHPMRFEIDSVTLLNEDESDDEPLKIEPGGAKKLKFLKSDLDRDFLHTIENRKKSSREQRDFSSYRFVVLIRHSRSSRSVEVVLEPLHSEFIPSEEYYVPSAILARNQTDFEV